MPRPRPIREPRRPDVIAATSAHAVERDLRQREIDDDLALAREEGERRRRESRPLPSPATDHSSHVCTFDPADPWSECITERPW